MTSTELLGHSHPWKPDGTQTDSNCDTTESDAAQSCTERTGSLPRLTLRAEKAGATLP